MNQSGSNLQAILWGVLEQLEAGKMDPGRADSVARQARAYLKTVEVRREVLESARLPIPADMISFAKD